MSKKYVVKWYDWHAGHYKQKECTSEQLNPFFSKLKNKKEISDITINTCYNISVKI